MSRTIPDTGKAPNNKDILDALEIEDSVSNIFPEDHNPAPEYLSALGNDGEILGSLTLRNSFGRIMMLTHIDSPFVDDSENDRVVDIIDQARCLYIMAHGEEALRPLYTVERKLKRLKQAEKLAGKNSDFFAMYLHKLDEIAEHESDFDIEALKHFDNHMTPETFQQTNEIIGDLIGEGLEGLDAIGEDVSSIDQPKKKES